MRRALLARNVCCFCLRLSFAVTSCLLLALSQLLLRLRFLMLPCALLVALEARLRFRARELCGFL